jgi:hypothetical protein
MNNINVNYCLHWPDGEIAMYGSCSKSQLKLQIMEGCKLKTLGVAFSVPNHRHYINGSGEHTLCESYTVDTIPVPCEIYIEGVKYEIGVGEPTPAFEFDAPGSYTIYVNAGSKYTREEFNVDQA